MIRLILIVIFAMFLISYFLELILRNNKLNPDDNNRVEQELVKAEQGLNPDKSVDNIYQELDQHRQS